jgi:Spy/CpxP family protein refolding chaperone
MRRFALALAFVAAFLAGGLLMNGISIQADDKVEPKIRGVLYPKWKDLGLSKDQVQAIYKIQSESRSKIDKLETEIRKLKAQEKADAEKLLTPAQKARLKELILGDDGKDKTTTVKDKPAPPKEK